jgi:hypothetical protein
MVTTAEDDIPDAVATVTCAV